MYTLNFFVFIFTDPAVLSYLNQVLKHNDVYPVSLVSYISFLLTHSVSCTRLIVSDSFTLFAFQHSGGEGAESPF